MTETYTEIIKILLAHKTKMYQICKSEFRELLQQEGLSNTSITGNIEIISSNIVGYTTKLMSVRKKSVEEVDEIISELSRISIFRSPDILDWLEHSSHNFPLYLTYIQSIESLRIALITFLTEPVNHLKTEVMIQELKLFCLRAALPLSTEWFKLLKDSFGLILEDNETDVDFDWEVFSGCLPYKGNIDYQYEFHRLSNDEIDKLNVPNFDFDSMITISSHGKKEFIAAIQSIAILAKLCGGLVYNTQTKCYLDYNELLSISN